MENQYFYLKKHCYLVNGNKGSAIYDLLNERLYTIDLEIGKLLDTLQNSNIRIKDVGIKRGTNIKEIFKYLTEIEDIGVGNFYKNRVVIEEVRPLVTKKQSYDKHGNWTLNRVFI